MTSTEFLNKDYVDYDLLALESKLRRKSVDLLHERVQPPFPYHTLILLCIASALITCCFPNIADGVLFVITPSACNSSIYEHPNDQIIEVQGNSTVVRNITALYIQQHTTMEWYTSINKIL